eukprot:Gb_01261 [translate_table: standard]
MGEPAAVKKARDLTVFPSVDELSVRLASYVAQLSDAAIKERGVFNVVLSGDEMLLCLVPLRTVVRCHRAQICLIEADAYQSLPVWELAPQHLATAQESLPEGLRSIVQNNKGMCCHGGKLPKWAIGGCMVEAQEQHGSIRILLNESMKRTRWNFHLDCNRATIHKKAALKLTEAPYPDTVDWKNWHVTWVDERVVPKTHPDSNYKLAMDGLLSKVIMGSNLSVKEGLNNVQF